MVSLDGSNWTAPTSGGSPTATKEEQGVLPVQMQTMSMSSTDTRYVLFTNLTNHGDFFVGIAEVRFEGVLTPDTTPPELVTLIPADGDVGVGVNADLKITFNDNITNGAGNITIKEVDGGTVVEAFAAATSPQLTWDYGSGRSVTIDPTDDLDPKTEYYVEIANGAIDDDAGNPYAGFLGAGTWSFTTSGPLITNTSVKAFSSEFGGRPAAHAVSGDGLPGDVPALFGVHSASAGDQWLNDLSTPLAFIVVDLGDNYVLDTIHVWNYNEAGATYGMKDVAISVSSTTDTNDLVALTTDGSGGTDDGAGGFLFPQGFNNNYYGFNVDLSSLTVSSLLDNVRLVEIRNTTTYTGNGAGLAEVHFGGEPWVEPPSGTVIMIR